MHVTMDAVLKNGKLLEASIFYTGDMLDWNHSKYDIKHYVAMAKELAAAGTHIIGLKDMGGLAKPEAAKALVKILKD